MSDDAPPKGFWASIKADVAKWREAQQQRREEFEDNAFKFLAAAAVMGGKLPKEIDETLGPKGKMEIATDILRPGSLEARLEELKQKRAEYERSEREEAARPSLSPEEEYRREAEDEMQMHFGRKAAYQAAGQRRIAEFLENEAANLSPEEVRREIQNINDWVQRKCDEL